MKIIAIVCCLFATFTSIVASSIKNQEIETVFVHGLNCSPDKLNKDYLPQELIQEPASAVKLQNGKKSPLGQGQDIETVRTYLDPDKKYCLFGHSRGGSTIINLMAQHNPKNVHMIVIDAAPADMLNIVDERQYKYGLFPFWTRTQKESILRWYHPNYPQNSTPPVQAIPNITNKELPVFIVHSHDDHYVNIQSGLQLYKAFKQAQFSNIYLCQLQHGKHCDNATGADNHIFKSALHSVYKKHGQSYNFNHAILQEHELTKFQPTIEEIDDKLRLNQWKLRTQSIINTGAITALALTTYALSKRK